MGPTKESRGVTTFYGWDDIDTSAPLSWQISEHVKRGWYVAYENDRRAIMVQPARRMSPTWHLVNVLLCLVTLGLWIPIYVIIAILDSREKNKEHRKELFAPSPDAGRLKR